MKARIRPGKAVVALGAIAALAVVSPALGGPSLKKLVKKEVAKQISKATGPTGPAGATGATGATGAAGTARAYAAVASHSSSACSPQCSISRVKGISGVTRPGPGAYCVTAPGISSADVPIAVTVDWDTTANPEGDAAAMVRASAADCPAGVFQVMTERQVPSTGTDAAPADNVGFTVVIP